MSVDAAAAAAVVDGDAAVDDGAADVIVVVAPPLSSVSLAGAGPSMKWMYTKVPAGMASTTTTAPRTIHFHLPCMSVLFVGYVSGSCRVKTAPPSTALAAVAVPLCSAAMPATIDNPSPAPAPTRAESACQKR